RAREGLPGGDDLRRVADRFFDALLELRSRFGFAMLVLRPLRTASRIGDGDDFDAGAERAVGGDVSLHHEAILRPLCGLTRGDAGLAPELLALVAEHETVWLDSLVKFALLLQLVFHFEQVGEIRVGLHADGEIYGVLCV